MVTLVQLCSSSRRFNRYSYHSNGAVYNKCYHLILCYYIKRSLFVPAEHRDTTTGASSNGRPSYSSITTTETNSNADATSTQRQKEQQSQKSLVAKRRLDVAVIGLPNAGKSQLLNVLCQSKVTAVSRKRHTTRQGILGIRSIEDTQLIFTDTPGYMKHEEAVAEEKTSNNRNSSISVTNRILQRLTKQAKQGVADSDISLLVIDAARTITDSVRETLASLMFYACLTHVQQQRHLLQSNNNSSSNSNGKLLPLTTTVPLIIVLNKVDLVKPKTRLLQLAYEMCLMANTCWDKAENFDMDDLEDDDEDNQAQPGKVIVAVDDESLNDFLPPDRTVEFVEPRSKASNAITTQQERQQQREYCPVFMVSALQNDGVQDIVQYLVKEAMPGDWVEMDGNTTNGTDMSPQEHATEIIREKIYRTVHQEVPYNVQQRTTRFEYVSAAAATAAGYSIPSPSHHHHLTEEDSLSTFGIPTTNTATTTNNNSEQSKILCIEQDFIVSTRSHKRLLEGKNGSILKRISDQARRDLQQVFHCYVSLTLRVKIKRTNNGSQIHQLTAEDDDEND